jgi:hypothetical protein
MSAVRLRFDPSADDSAVNSRAAVEKVAMHVAREGRSSERLHAFQDQCCCSGVQEWWQGRDAPALEAALERLEPGEITTSPVEANQSFYVLQRRLPSTPKAADVRFELPF